MRLLEASKCLLLLHLNVFLYDDLLPTERKQQTAVTKITGLLRVGFGGAGADIIAKVRTRNDVHAHAHYLHRGFLSIGAAVMIFILVYSIFAWMG